MDESDFDLDLRAEAASGLGWEAHAGTPGDPAAADWAGVLAAEPTNHTNGSPCTATCCATGIPCTLADGGRTGGATHGPR
ncbi:hypothetical protein [Bailinhaonella thermotolerans]|uniref:Uncharacterized protein n=1 Tax=Bailinhaonella thermotolerans TaxID=1070861 RepID=A0A3A4A756_9ACTN|nr:hypothetical protein [Bailinhaonella thermotolerans]RJL24786.1 hypothetical protein D5H75_28815 [Bailinhaonella thermotolerans]